MTRNELKQILEDQRFDPRVYSLNGGLPSEALCIAHEHGRWCYYYSERGDRTGEKWFESEADACHYLLSELRSLPDYDTRLPHTPRG
jgi:hypothetical protein